MAKNDKIELLPSIVTEVKVDKGDVVAIGLHKAERWIYEQLKAARGRKKVAAEAIGKLNKSVTVSTRATADTYLSKRMNAFETAARNLGFDKVDIKCETQDAKTIVELVENPPRGKTWNRDITVRVEVQLTNDAGYRSGVAVQHTTKCGIDVVSNAKQILKLRKELEQAIAIVGDMSQKLTKMPALERAARASLAAERLNQTPEGKKLVESMSNELLAQVKALPSATD